MAITFLPTIYSKRMIATLDKFLVAAKICNTDFVGDVVSGNTVKAMMPGDITVYDYTKNTDLATPQVTTETVTTISIDQQKAVNFFLDQIDLRQVPVNLQEAYFIRAMYAIRDTIDQFVFGQYVNVHANNKVTPALTLSSTNVYAEIASLYRKLTDSKVPLDSRFLTVSPRVLEIMNAYLAGKSTPLGDNATTNGYVGKFAGFDIYLSHNVPATAEDVSGTSSTEVVHNCLAGHPMGITLAKQIPLDGPGSLKVNFDPEKRFGTLVKGLTVYGGKMLYSGAANGLLRAWWTS